MKKPERESPTRAPNTGSQETGWRRSFVVEAARPLHQDRTGPPPRKPAFYLPVPLSCTVCVPTASLIFRVALRAPVTVGVNVTVMVQSQPGFRLDPQADFALKSPALVPPNVTLLIESDVLWSLVRMTVAT